MEIGSQAIALAACALLVPRLAGGAVERALRRVHTYVPLEAAELEEARRLAPCVTVRGGPSDPHTWPRACAHSLVAPRQKPARARTLCAQCSVVGNLIRLHIFARQNRQSPQAAPCDRVHKPARLRPPHQEADERSGTLW